MDIDKESLSKFTKGKILNYPEIQDLINNREEYCGKIVFLISEDHAGLVQLFKNIDRYFFKSEVSPRIRFTDGKRIKRLDDVKECRGDIIAIDMLSLKNDGNINQICNFSIETKRLGVICLYTKGQKDNLSLIEEPVCIEVV